MSGKQPYKTPGLLEREQKIVESSIKTLSERRKNYKSKPVSEEFKQWVRGNTK